MTTTIQLVDDHRIVLDGLRSIIAKHPDLEVVAEASDGLSALRVAQEVRPDLVVLDVTLPGLSGIEVIKRLRHLLPETKVVALSMHADQVYVAAMLRAGASAYVLKDDDSDEIITAVRRVANGQSYLSSCLRRCSVTGVRPGPDNRPSGAASLTCREREILEWLGKGETTKGIALGLHLSPKTVYTHREHIMEKLDVRNGAALIRAAVLICSEERLGEDDDGPD